MPTNSDTSKATTIRNEPRVGRKSDGAKLPGRDVDDKDGDKVPNKRGDDKSGRVTRFS